MSILSDLLRDVAALFFPPRCPVCGVPLAQGERTVCTLCRTPAPLTGFWLEADNPLLAKCRDMLPVERASGFLYYIHGSGWRELIRGFKYRGAWRTARAMGEWYGRCLKESGLYDGVEVVVPLPLHPVKRCRRGYNQSEYIRRITGAPPSQNTSVEYLPLGELKFARMLEELEKAEHYIFLEYFIIQEGRMWDPILEVLERKAKAGLDVRVMYDDLGCMMTLPPHYKRVLEEKGIRCCVFNPFVPVLSSRLNNRDHRKICVIDGHTGFTGGINLADEYINAYPKHGHWKDTAVLLRGDAVWSLTLMFLSLWDYVRGTRDDYALYHPRRYQREPVASDGVVQPYTDSPLDDEAVGETVYLNLINKADRYVYITTPYRIISSEMITALATAAKSGLDVRIITPHVADKWYVHAVTRAYYEVLIEAGVRIYEYTPGFIHAKTFTVDDEYGVVGTINLDFRSLYLHFECAAWLYRCSCIPKMREDFMQTLAVSQEVTLEECRGVGLVTRVVRSVLRVFAPLM